MEENIVDTNTVRIAAQVIIFAGNARVFLNEAVAAIEAEDFEKVETLITKAEKEITKAHEIQTDVIQSEARGERLEISLLLTHAQDTLMSANTEIRLTRHIFRLYKKLHAKINS
jgi:PTS system cellobiose-specific IIA component